MFSFKKKTTPIQNMAFMALMAAINIVFVLLTTFVPVLVVLIIFVLPLTSVLVTLFCQKRYYPLYFVATIALCMICTIWNISDTIFYVIPSMIAGFIFGIFVIYKFPLLYLILGPSIVYFAFAYAFIPLIKFWLNIDIVNTFLVAFKLENFENIGIIIPSFIFVIALIQSIISYIIIKDEIAKFGNDIIEKKAFSWINILMCALLIALSVTFAFFYLPFAYLFMIINLIIVFYLIGLDILERNRLGLIISGVAFFITFLAFSIAYQYLPNKSQFLMVNLLYIIVLIKTIINKCLLRENNKDKINTPEE